MWCTDGNFSEYIELNGWLEFATMLRDNFAASFGFPVTEEINGLPIIKYGKNTKNVIMIVHPFWDLRVMRVENWLTDIKNELNDYTTENNGKLHIVDTFNLHRRPGWCYEKLVRI